MLCFCVFFFFFKQKTAYELRISDWSSDVCSSDLPALVAGRGHHRAVDEHDRSHRHLAGTARGPGLLERPCHGCALLGARRLHLHGVTVVEPRDTTARAEWCPSPLVARTGSYAHRARSNRHEGSPRARSGECSVGKEWGWTRK